MFTGLVEGIGQVHTLEPTGVEIRLTIDIPEQMLGQGSCAIGDSVAINGCCLTVVAINGAAWIFQAGQETLSKTTLGDLQKGSRVNLERALPATGRLGGHIVQGHIDGVGAIASIEPHGEWTDIVVDLPPDLANQLVTKGSVAVDGVSLTVVSTTHREFTVALIPHTLANTTLGNRQVGDQVNLEMDIIGKYIHRWLADQREYINKK